MTEPATGANVSAVPEDTQVVLRKVREVILSVAPAATERISYQMPTFTLDGRDLIYVAAWKHHISMYPAPAVDEAFERELAPYRSARATVKFPLKKQIPYELIRRLVALRLEQLNQGGEAQ